MIIIIITYIECIANSNIKPISTDKRRMNRADLIARITIQAQNVFKSNVIEFFFFKKMITRCVRDEIFTESEGKM